MGGLDRAGWAKALADRFHGDWPARDQSPENEGTLVIYVDTDGRNSMRALTFGEVAGAVLDLLATETLPGIAKGWMEVASGPFTHTGKAAGEDRSTPPALSPAEDTDTLRATLEYARDETWRMYCNGVTDQIALRNIHDKAQAALSPPVRDEGRGR